MTPVDPSRTVLHADQEHSGVRLLVLLILLVALVVSFVVLNALIRAVPSSVISDYSMVLSCLLALPIGLGITALLERLIKRTWHSGRSLTLDEKGLEVRLSDEESFYVDWAKRFSTIKWTFSLKGFPRGGRERRVPADWNCFGLQLQQDEHRLIVHCYMPDKRAKSMVKDDEFREIRPAEFYDDGRFRRVFTAPSRPNLPASVLTGRQGPYWLAERRRWSEGLELTVDDFTLVMEAVDRHSD